MRVTRAPSEAAPPSAASTIAAAPAPQRASNAVPGPGRERVGAITSAMRAEPAPTASARAEQRLHARVRANPSRARRPTLRAHPSARRGTRGSGPRRRAGGSCPTTTRRRGRRRGPPRRGRGPAASPGEGEGVLVGRADGDLAPAPCGPRRRRPRRPGGGGRARRRRRPGRARGCSRRDRTEPPPRPTQPRLIQERGPAGDPDRPEGSACMVVTPVTVSVGSRTSVVGVVLQVGVPEVERRTRHDGGGGRGPRKLLWSPPRTVRKYLGGCARTYELAAA